MDDLLSSFFSRSNFLHKGTYQPVYPNKIFSVPIFVEKLQFCSQHFGLDNPVIFCFPSVLKTMFTKLQFWSRWTSKTELEKNLFHVTRQKFSRAFKMWSKIGYGSLCLFFRVQSNIGERGEYVSKRLFWNSAILWKNAIKDVFKYLGGNIIPKQYKH